MADYLAISDHKEDISMTVDSNSDEIPFFELICGSQCSNFALAEKEISTIVTKREVRFSYGLFVRVIFGY